MTSPRDEDQHYGVEVSGWNTKENFFVEQASLEWTPDGAKSVRLKADLGANTIVFLRLLQHGPEPNQLPIAYKATELSNRGRDGRVQVALQQLHPREKRHAQSPRDSTREEMAVPT